MPLDSAITEWLDGGDVRVVAPFAEFDRIVRPAGEAARDVVVLLSTDAAALVWAARNGAGVLLRTTARVARDRWFSRPAGARGVLAVSLDSLHSPALRAELAGELGGAPWCVPFADRLHPTRAGHGGRLSWVARRHAECAGAGLLWIHADVNVAPDGTPVAAGEPGPVVRVADRADLGRVLAGAAPAIVWRRPPRALERGLGEAGLPVRTHRLDRLRPRDWDIAEAALRHETSGVDALRYDGPAGPAMRGRWTLALDAPSAPGELAGPPGAGILLAAVDAAAGSGARAAIDAAFEPVDGAAIDRCRTALGSGDPATRFAVPGGTEGVASALLADLAAVGCLAELRPACFAAVVSDPRRFRPPFTDREPTYRELQSDYEAARAGWSLREQAELALTHRGPQDLRKLADALDRSPGEIADTLLAMTLDSIVTVRVEGLGAGGDHEGRRGPRWAAPAAEVAADVEALRERRRDARRAATELASTPMAGCRTAAVARRLTEVEPPPCGVCDLCDPARGSLAGVSGIQQAAPARAHVRVGTSGPTQASGLSAVASGGLFADLDEKPRRAQAVGRPAPQGAGHALRGLIARGDPGALREALDQSGDGSVLARATFQRRHQGRTQDLPAELVPDLLGALRAEVSPAGLPVTLASGTVAARVRGGRIELQRTSGPFPGTQSLAPVSGSPGYDDALARLADIEPTGEAADLLRAAAARARWRTYLDQVERVLREGLDRAAGIPDASSALIEPPAGEPSPGWEDLFAMARVAAAGDPTAALALLVHAVGPGLDLLRAAYRAAAGDWAGLWSSGEVRLRRRAEPATVVTRLEMRALLGVEPPPALGAAGLDAWLDRTAGDAGPTEAELVALIGALGTGRPVAFARLASRFAEGSAPAARAAHRAMELGALPPGFLPALLQEVEGAEPAEQAGRVVAILLASGGAAGAAAAYRSLAGGLDEGVWGMALDQLKATPGPVAQAVVAAAEREEARRAARQADQERLRSLDAAGKLQEFGRAYSRVLVASSLPPDQQAAAAEAAERVLSAAAEEGWLEPILAVLRAQCRRHPGDPVRALWLARALLRGSRWAAAEVAYAEAADAEHSPEARRERLLEAVGVFFQRGEDERAARLLEDFTKGPPSRVVGAAIVRWADEGSLHGPAAARVASLLRAVGSGVYAAAIRRLDAAAETPGS